MKGLPDRRPIVAFALTKRFVVVRHQARAWDLGSRFRWLSMTTSS
jgi:hypothetical protein